MATLTGTLDWRSPSARLVLEAVLDILVEVGYDGLTVEEVRERAGPAGQALGELPDLDALVGAALARIELLPAPKPTGRLREDLQAFLRPWRGPCTRDEVIIAGVLSAAERRPTLHEAVHRAFDQPVAHALGKILSRHQADSRMVERLQTLNWVLRGLLLERLRTGARAAVDLERLVDFLMAGMGAPDATAEQATDRS